MVLPRHRVVVLLLPPVVGFDAAIPPQLFGTAVDNAGHRLYEVQVAGLSTDPVETAQGYSIVPQADASALAGADTVIVPGTHLPEPRETGTLPADVRAALGRIRPGTRIVSICTGAFVLGAAGLLDDRPATTHWFRAALFRARFPRVGLDESQLFVDDGDVLTSAGLAAGVDLCLHIIRRDHGVEVANRVARQCVVPPWRDGGQAQYIEAPMGTEGRDSTAATREWALGRLGQNLDVAALAAHARMSVRTFNRRFQSETGTAPGGWIVEHRVRYARELLERTDLGVDEIARRCGLGTGASLRQHLRTALGVSPLAYRRTFRGHTTAPSTP